MHRGDRGDRGGEVALVRLIRSRRVYFEIELPRKHFKRINEEEGVTSHNT